MGQTFGGFGTYMYLCAQNQQVMRKRIFKRKVYDKMLEWKRERNGSTDLIDANIYDTLAINKI